LDGARDLDPGVSRWSFLGDRRNTEAREAMSNNRIVAVGYLVLAILAGVFLQEVFVRVFSLASTTQPMTTDHDFLGYEKLRWSYCTLLGLGIAFGAAAWLYRAPRSHEVALEIAAELRKVSWPSAAETRAATVAVIVASLIAACLLGLFDVFWQFLTDKIQNPSL
jgi:preprotein translocase subunit SecE